MMKKRIIVALFAALCTACGVVAVRHASLVHTASSVCDGALYAKNDGVAAVYDGSSRTFHALSVDRFVYDMCSTGDGNVWLLANAEDDTADLLLYDGDAVVQTIPLDFRPLSVRTYRNGLLLVRRQPWTQMTEYLKQGVSLSAVMADILYLNTDTLQQTKLVECGFPWSASEAQGDFFAVYGNVFVFRPSSLQIGDDAGVTSIVCDDRFVCVYTVQGDVKEITLPQEAVIRDIFSTSDGFIAVGNRGLYAFSTQDGLGEVIVSRKEIPPGVCSSDRRYYLYTKKTGFFADNMNIYAVRISDGRTMRLWRQRNVSEDLFMTIYFF